MLKLNSPVTQTFKITNIFYATKLAIYYMDKVKPICHLKY